MAKVQRLRFGPLTRPVVLTGCPEILVHFAAVFRGWTIDPHPDEGSGEPILRLIREDGGYRLEADWLSAPLRLVEPVDAVCAFIAELLKAMVIDDPDLLCLHGAAVELGGRLVVFPNRYHAGKSTLAACFAAAGHRIFSDDVLPITEPGDQARAPGIAPRLRLPLPDDLGEGTRAFLEAHAGPSGWRYRYLDLPAERLAPFGTPATIGAFVLIERDPQAEPELTPIGRGETLHQVIWQNFGREGDAGSILRRLHRIVDRAGCYRLRYRRAEEAVDFLAETFGDWQAPAADPRRMAKPMEADSGPAPGSISQVTVEGERFVAESGAGAIHHLNALASALWRLHEEQVAPGEMVETVHAAFPDVPRNRIERDVAKLLRDFKCKGLTVRADDEVVPGRDGGPSDCRLQPDAGNA